MSQFFQLGTFSVAGCPPFAGVVVNEKVIAITGLATVCEQMGQPLRGAESTLGLLQEWEENFATLQTVLASDQINSLPSIGLGPLKVHAPILYPRQIFCAGANYRQHVIELVVAQNKSPETQGMTPEERYAWGAEMMDKRAKHGIPYIFSKVASAITGPYDPIFLPQNSEQPDWELELVVVMGKTARRVVADDALDYVAGYTIGNDVSNRDLIHRSDMKAIGTDWLAGKSSPSYLPMGPFITPAAFIDDPQELHLTLKLNGDVMQAQAADDMIFNIKQLIAYASSLCELWPGDVLLTGSPKGNGTHYGRFLQPGDVMEGEIKPLGIIRNTCVAEEITVEESQA